MVFSKDFVYLYIWMDSDSSISDMNTRTFLALLSQTDIAKAKDGTTSTTTTNNNK